MLAAVVEEQGLGAPFALVVAGARADRVDVAPVVLGLRVDLGVAVHLRGRRQKDAGSGAFGQPQHVDRTQDRRLGRLHRVTLVEHRRRRTGQVVDLVDLDEQREGQIVPQELEPGIGQQVMDAAAGRRVEVVHTQDFGAGGQQRLAQVAADEPGAAGDQDARRRGRIHDDPQLGVGPQIRLA